MFHIDYEIYRFHKENAIQWLTFASLVINFNDVLFLPGLYLHLVVGLGRLNSDSEETAWVMYNSM